MPHDTYLGIGTLTQVRMLAALPDAVDASCLGPTYLCTYLRTYLPRSSQVSDTARLSSVGKSS